MTLATRALATEAVIQKYRDKPFDWHSAHCIGLAHDQAKALGHKVPKLPKFKNALGAKRALKREGVETVTELLDKHFVRHVAPAFMLVGDICVLEGDGGDLEAVCIADGQGSLFGWHDDKPDGLAVIKFALADIKAAWRL